MKHTLFNKPTLVLTIFLMIIVAAVGVSAYKEPIAPWPVNTTEPIDTGMVNQAKVGPLSVTTFFGRGNADFKKDLTIEGVAQGGNPGDTTSTVQITSNVLATGDLKSGSINGSTTAHLSAQNITHGEPQPKTVCADTNGNVVFCKDVCSNINGEQSTAPDGYQENADGTCTVIPDLCSNVPGLQQTLNQDLTIDDATQPTFCTQTIRATIYAGRHGSYASLNMAHEAYMTNMKIKNITIQSIGGDPTRTAWPSATPLRFQWGFCAKRDPAYSGSGPQQRDYAGSIATGICIGFNPDYPYLNTLPSYGTWNYGTWPSPYYSGVAWDGVHNMLAHWIQSEGYQLWVIDDPKGTFDAYSYDRYGQTDKWAYGYNIYVKLPPGGHPNEIYDQNYIMSHLEYKLPLERLVLSDVKVPLGYKLVLTNDTVKSPGTVLDVHPVTNSIYIANAPAANVTRVNAYIPGGFGVDLALDGRKWADHVPNGTYSVSVQCSSGTGSSIPNSFTLPKDWGVGLTVKCQ